MTDDQVVIYATTGQPLDRQAITLILGCSEIEAMRLLNQLVERGEVFLSSAGKYQASEPVDGGAA
jgi:hypothetical protein